MGNYLMFHNFEIIIQGKGRRDIQPLHLGKTNTIGKAEDLVVVFFKDLPGSLPAIKLIVVGFSC
ncbi:MAG: hypothetical protein R6U40_06805 [Desulfobacterales bacterium]